MRRDAKLDGAGGWHNLRSLTVLLCIAGLVGFTSAEIWDDWVETVDPRSESTEVMNQQEPQPTHQTLFIII